MIDFYGHLNIYMLDLVHLKRLVANGHGDSATANVVREAMDKRWKAMGSEERQEARAISSALSTWKPLKGASKEALAVE